MTISNVNASRNLFNCKRLFFASRCSPVDGEIESTENLYENEMNLWAKPLPPTDTCKQSSILETLRECFSLRGVHNFSSFGFLAYAIKMLFFFQ